MEYFQSPTRIWVLVFVYTLLAGIALQLVVLPHLLPTLHAGDGLFKGLDGPKFHRIATAKYQAITEQGWQAWEPTPGGQLVSGVASAIYGAIYPKPWALLPLNAALNATAALCMVLLLRRVTGEARQGTLAALPFVLFPSSLLWNAQLHNENYAVPGVCMLLLGWSGVVSRSAEDRSARLWVSLLLVAAGSFLVGAVRIYVVGLMLGLFLLVGAAILLVAALHVVRSRVGGAAVLTQAAGVLLAALAMTGALLALDGGPNDTAELQQLAEERTGAEQRTTRARETGKGMLWQQSAWLPSVLDSRFRDLARTRRIYTRAWSDSGSLIDADVELNSSEELLNYLPRALQISLFSPFPNVWFTAGQKVTGQAFRAAVVPETLVAYACLLGLPFAIWACRRAPALWVALAACTGMLLVYGMVAPNQGTIFRFRFPYYLPLVCLGLWGWLDLARRRSSSGPGSPPGPAA